MIRKLLLLAVGVVAGFLWGDANYAKRLARARAAQLAYERRSTMRSGPFCDHPSLLGCDC